MTEIIKEHPHKGPSENLMPFHHHLTPPPQKEQQ
jgi:hypothetical protein